ncbi:MAG: hypothetical protein CVU05_11830 [Bacteroidetes bacterium HGW-Bacteroidetes-21]|nr:MAG: hypothetical protein CVU05_11830 [Bacteroidetes bacterium HGW-Bacteroidetes-21]
MSKAQNTDYGNQAFLTYKMLEKFHFSPRALDDTFSQNMFDLFIESLDPHCRIFTNNDYLELSKYALQQDDEILNKSDVFVKKVITLYKVRLLEADSIISKIMEKPLNLNEKDTLILYRGYKRMFPESEVLRRAKWEKNLKYKFLVEYYGSFDNIKNPSPDEKQIVEDEAKVREKIKTRVNKRIKNILNSPMGFDNYVVSLYLNAIATCFDPHSNFFMPQEEASFKKMLSTQALAFGFMLETNENDEILISHLVPGSSAWKSNMLNIGDVLINIEWEKGKSIDLSSMELEEAQGYISEIPSKTVILTVIKQDGSRKSVHLEKTLLKVEDNTITSYVLKGKENIGYIPLPDFYTSAWENSNVMGCSNDVAKEILKLQKDSIKGLILDLRYNGGGSVAEALNLIGIFIDEGPLSITQYKGSKPMLLKDMNRGTIYNGPLIVLVNGASASASELVAASLQDYKKAIIVGSPTYGKATGQQVLPVDTSINNQTLAQKYDKSFGYLKITCQKIYRLNGKSYQKTGVKPDVLIPDIMEFFNYRESESPYCLPSDSIVKKVIYNPLLGYPMSEIISKSSARINADSVFCEIKKFETNYGAYLKNEQQIMLQRLFKIHF